MPIKSRKFLCIASQVSQAGKCITDSRKKCSIPIRHRVLIILCLEGYKANFSEIADQGLKADGFFHDPERYAFQGVN